jgi:hypothetical protein
VGEHRLAGIREKLARADEQIEFVNAEWGRFLKEEEPYGIDWKYDPDSAEYFLYKPHFRIFKDPPIRMAVLLGEIVHNLRSALDHLACELIECHGARPIRRAAWPVAVTEADWINQVEWPRDRTGKRIRGPLHGLSRNSDAWAYVKLTQPYQRGQTTARSQPLAELNKLSRTDKHSVVHSSYVYPGGDIYEWFRFNAQAHFITAFPLQEPGAPLEDDAPLAMFGFARTGPDPNVGVKRGIPFDLSFGVEEGERERGNTLMEMRAEVARIVNDCRVWTG